METEANRSATAPAAEILWQLDKRMHEVAILRAALELDVWAEVAAGEDSVEQLSETELWDPLGTRMLL
jgi:hypothetical protein